MYKEIELKAGRQQQRGFALLVSLLVLVIGAATLFVSARPPAPDGATRDPAASVSLDRAHDAVIAYAQFGGANNKPGALPCPDSDHPPDGSANSFDCQNAPKPVYIGRLPWQTIDLAQHFGGRASELWYAFDGHYQDDPDDPPILNAGTSADLTVDGAPVVAVVILAGDPLAHQGGRSSKVEADYLEGENADGDTAFTDCSDVDGCNDRVLGIGRDRLFDRVQRRVIAGVEAALVRFHARSAAITSDRYLPYPSAFNDSDFKCDAALTPARGRLARETGSCTGTATHLRDTDFNSDDQWILDNGWLAFVVYEVADPCTEAERNCGGGTLAVDGDTGFDVVIAGAGRALGAQTRPGANVADYLEDTENTNVDGAYIDGALTPTDNDVFLGAEFAP